MARCVRDLNRNDIDILNNIVPVVLHTRIGEMKKPNNSMNGEQEIILQHTMQSSGLEIMESSINDDLTGENKVQMTAVLTKYMQKWLERTEHFLGYPINLNFDFDCAALGQLQQFSINNAGDPFVEGNYGVHSRDFELGVLDWFANLWEIGKDKYWGYVTNGGTEGNLHGILVGEIFSNGILYASKESHYSVFKAAHMYRMECFEIDTFASGEIDYGVLKARLLQNKDKPAILNVNIGTTVKGAIDDIDLITKTLEECGFPENQFYIHCDAALFGLILPFLNHGPQITFKKPIGSVSISGHKFLGCPMPCGVQIVRIEHINALSKSVEYLATRDATILGSRNGHNPIFLWYTLNRKGHHGLRRDVQQCLENAQYLKDQLREARVSVMLNEFSNTVVFERPLDEGFIKHWQLACQGNITHVIVMPNVSKEKINIFVDELVKNRLIWYKDGGNQAPCVAFEIGKENCDCTMHM